VTTSAAPNITTTGHDWPSVHTELAEQHARCLWQDLDGLHVADPPASAPLTSMLWAWSATGLWRIRIDGDSVYGARLDTATQTPNPTARPMLPWAPTDQRIAAHTATAVQRVDALRFEQILIDGIAQHAQPMIFLRPAAHRGESTEQR